MHRLIVFELVTTEMELDVAQCQKKKRNFPIALANRKCENFSRHNCVLNGFREKVEIQMTRFLGGPLEQHKIYITFFLLRSPEK